MTEFVLTSSRDGASLTLRYQAQWRLTVALQGPGLSAGTTIWYEDGPGFADFLASLATAWPGWEGEREWGSDYGELEIDATCDRTGHVQFAVLLKESAIPLWEVRQDLYVDLGQLDGLARHAAHFEEAVLALHA